MSHTVVAWLLVGIVAVVAIIGCVMKEPAKASSIREPVAEPTVAPVISKPVIGPPAKIIVEANPKTIRCGEKSTITVTVQDSKGQTVQQQLNVQLSATTNPPWRIGTFDQPIVTTQNGIAQTAYKGFHLPSTVQITAFIGGLFGLTSLETFC